MLVGGMWSVWSAVGALVGVVGSRWFYTTSIKADTCRYGENIRYLRRSGHVQRSRVKFLWVMLLTNVYLEK